MRQAGDGVHGARDAGAGRVALAGGGCASTRRSRSPSTTSTRVSERSWCVTARAAAAARSAWTAGPGSTCGPGSSCAWPCRSVRCCAWSRGRTRGRPWASDAARAQLRRVASKAGVRRRFAPHQLRHAHAIELAHEGVPLYVIQRQFGAYQSRRHVDLPAGDRQRRDHRHRPRSQGAHDPRQCRTAPLDGATSNVAVGRTGTGRVEDQH